MKTVLSILTIILLSNIVNAQTTAIPDVNFEQRLINLGYDSGTPDGVVLTSNINTVTNLAVGLQSIADLTGIEDFTALESLGCAFNQLTNLNLTQNTALKILNCNTNQLTSINLSQNTALFYLDIQANQLTSLDLSQNTLLETLKFDQNQISTVDLSQNINLKSFNCFDNGLTSLDLTNNTALEFLGCHFNEIPSLDVSQNTALTQLHCYNNQITSLDISQNSALTYIDCRSNELVCLFAKNGNNVNFSGFWAYSNPNLSCIEVDDVAYSTANWTNVDAQTYYSTSCNTNCSPIINDPHENGIWYFGDHAGVDFSTGFPISLSNGATNASGGSACISDNNGILFYAADEFVYNKNHAVMPNGSGIHGNEYAAQSSLIVPNPGSPSTYYVFTNDAPNGSSSIYEGLSYATIDMTLDGGNGDVTSKNNYLITPTTGKLTGIKHSNGVDTWVITHTTNSNDYYAYLVSATGVNPTPVISSTGFMYSQFWHSNGFLKSSLDGTVLADVIGNTGIDILNFDASLGTINYQYNLPGSNFRAYGTEFSPDGSKLYLGNSFTLGSDPGTIYQYNLLAGDSVDVKNSETLVATVNAPNGLNSGIVGSLLLGPDNKIYISRGTCQTLAVIHNPNNAAASCNFVDHAVALSGNAAYTGGLPNNLARGAYNPTTYIGNPTLKNNDIVFYPNPTSNQLRIETKQEIDEINIIDMTGKTIKTFKAGTYALNVADLSSGIYFIKLTGEEYTITKKFIKQ